MKKSNFLVFYATNPLFLKDIDREIFTSDKKASFHLFFFHNRDLHFNRDVITKEVLDKKFSEVMANYIHDTDNSVVTQIKRIENFDYYQFEKDVDLAYESYTRTINYRINSIIETINLFLQLYKEKSIVFVLPAELIDLIKNRTEGSLFIKDVENKRDVLSYYEIFYWINYFSRLTNEFVKSSDDLNVFTLEDIKVIYEVMRK